MKISDVKHDIFELLMRSSISYHQKRMTRTLLPIMSEKKLRNIHKALKFEARAMTKLDDKQKRIEMKYQVMVERLVDMQLKKRKN